MFRTARLVGIAGNLDGAVIGCRVAVDEPLRVEGSRTTITVGHALGDAAAVGIDEPGQIQHLAKRDGAEIKIETRYEHVVAGIEKRLGEQKEIGDKLAFIDSDALHSFANLLLD